MATQTPAPIVQLNTIQELKGRPDRQLGFGAAPADFEKNGKRYSARDAMIGMIKATCVQPSSALRAIESNTVSFDGPLSTANLKALTGGGQVNLLTPQPIAGASGQLSTMAQVGELQQYMMVCAIQWRFDVYPMNCAVKGNSVSLSSAQAKPVSPDAFVSGINTSVTNSDWNAGATGPLGFAAQGMTPSVAEIGYWQDNAAYFMARALRLDWNYGLSHLFLKEAMQYTMFVPSNAQNGSASDSEIDLQQTLLQGNNYYLSSLNSTNQFLQIDRSRYGNATLGAQGQSVFHPTRAYDTVGVTYGGGMSKQLLGGNSEWRRLDCPVLVGPGIPLGIVGTIVNQDAFTQMFNWLDPACGLGGATPADFTESARINSGSSVAGGSAVTGAEISVDAAATVNGLQVLADRVVYKFGPWSLTIALRGVEMTRDQLATLSNPAGLSMIAAQTGLRVAPNQLWHK